METTYQTYEIKTLLPPHAHPDHQFLEQLQTENHLLKQDLDKQLTISKQLEVRLRDFTVLQRNFEDLTQKYSESQARNRSLELDIETFQQRGISGEEEIRHLRHIVAERPPVEQLTEKLAFQEKRVDELLKEIESWKSKYQSVAAVKEHDIEELKVTLAAVSQANLEKSVNLIRAKYESEMEKMNLEIKRLADVLQSKNLSLEEMRGKDEQIRLLKSTLMQRDMELKELQGKIQLLTQEREQLMVTNRSLAEELAAVKERMGRLTILERLEEQMKEKLRENDVLLAKVRELENLLRDLKNFEDTIREYENKIAMISSELERMRMVNTNKGKELQELQEKYNRLDSKYNEALTLEVRLLDAEKALELKDKDNQQLRLLLQQKDDAITALEQQIALMQEGFREIEVLKETIVAFEKEVKGYEALVEEKLRELELLREENLKYETLLKEKSLSEGQTRDYEERITLLIRELDELRGKYIILETSVYSVTEYEAKTRELEDRNAELSVELDRLYVIIREKDLIIEEWEVRFNDIEGLHREKVHWEESLREADARYEALKKELEALRQHDCGLEVRNQFLEEKLHEYEEDFVKMGVERENLLRINKELLEKIARLEALLNEMRLVIEERERKIRELDGRIQELQDGIRGKHEEKVKMKGQVDANNAKMTELIKELEALRARLAGFEEERGRLIRENEALKMEIGGLKKNITIMQQELEKRTREFEELKVRFGKAMADLDRLTVVLQNKDAELEKKNGLIAILERDLKELVLKYQGLERKIAGMVPEMERLNGILEKKDFEIERLQGIIEGLQKENKDWANRFMTLESQFNKNMAEFERMKLVLLQYEAEMVKQDEIIANMDREIKELTAKCLGLENKLALLSSELERLKGLLTAKDAELARKDQIIVGLENKIAMLSSELERVKSLLQKKDQELLRLNEELRQFEVLRRELEEWRLKYSLIEKELRDLQFSKEQDLKNSQFLKQSSGEFKLKYEQSLIEIENWKVKYITLERETSAKILALENKIALLSSEFERVKSLLARKDQELENFRLESQGKMGLLDEVEMLRKLKAQAEAELSDWKNRFIMLQNDNQGLIAEIERLKGELGSWKARFEKQEAEFREKLMMYENKISLMSGEIERLKRMVQKKDGELGNSMRASREWDFKLKQTEEVAERFKVQIGEMNRDMEGLRGRNMEMLMRIVILNSEVDRLRLVAQV